MKKVLIAIVLIALISENSYSATFNWWGMISFRLRYEIKKDYIDATAPNADNWGDVKYTDTNSKTRLGYKLGFNVEVNDYITAAMTLRSGVGVVMWQDINSDNAGLNPGLFEAYINWQPPYAQIQLGRFPQQGNAMWDIYAATKYQTDKDRQDDPTDGIFNDRMGALNGVKIIVPVGPLNLTGIYHTDFVGGYRTVFESENKPPEVTPKLDQKIFLAGFDVNITNLTNVTMDYFDKGQPISEIFNLECYFDYGLPFRIGDDQNAEVKKDSVYNDEEMWGTGAKAAVYFEKLKSGLNLDFSYGYDWRDSVYASRFWDYKLNGEYSGYKLTFRYQYNNVENYDPDFIVDKVFREAFHFYLTMKLWELEIQPRYIRFYNESEKIVDVLDQSGNIIGQDAKRFKSPDNTRYEITTTIRF
ncbi:MAG: hypothetical protein HQ568_00540 [Calditrichaeota bacterium]|nr:hypothetical protein [Calditrichota bacterium]